MAHYGIKGFFTLEIVDELSGRVELRAPVKNNLILNQGVDYVAARSFVENMLYCAVAVSAVPPLLTDTGLVGEIMRTGDVDGSVENSCITTLVGNVYSITKVFRFPTLLTPTTIGTLGLSYSATAGNNLFSKSLVITESGGPGPVTAGVGKYFRVSYTIQITIGPSTVQTGSANITGWTAPAQWMMQYIGLKKLNANGSIGFWDAGQDANEPSASAGIFLGQSSAAPAAFGSTVNRSGSTNYVTTSSNTYLGGGRLIKQGSFGKTASDYINLRSMGVGVAGSSTSNTSFVTVFDGNQTKGADYLLPLQFVYSWA